MHKVASKLNWAKIGYREIPLPPKGMHVKTFNRIWTEYKELEQQESNLMIARYANFAKRHNINLNGLTDY